MQGIIKQRFTDFLVFEVDQQNNVVHLQSIARPDVERETAVSVASAPNNQGSDDIEWQDAFAEKLTPFLSEKSILALQQLIKEGPIMNKPDTDNRCSNNNAAINAEVSNKSRDCQEPIGLPESSALKSRKYGDRKGSRKKSAATTLRDDRKVLSQSLPSKEQRTSLHMTVRDLFKGRLFTEAVNNDANSQQQQTFVSISWVPSGSRRRTEGLPEDKPPFIHFTLQKTNRDTNDALSYLSRTLHVSVKDLGVAGTKDKRAVTVQRVSLRRGSKKIEGIWDMCNGLGRIRTMDQIMSERAEHGIRIGDLSYRKTPLDLGMLKGNSFVITLRSVAFHSEEVLEAEMQSLKQHGFINYYGMQRFGSGAIPTHAIGLALLRSDWNHAVSLILRPRPGEHPDAEAGRRAWLEEKDLEKALSLIPRRVVAERCILESYRKQKGDDRNALGVLSTIPRNLRLMYIHAYQSYLWNVLVSERIRKFGSDRPIVGDLVLVRQSDSGEVGEIEDINLDEMVPLTSNQPDNVVSKVELVKLPKTAWQAAEVKILAEEDLPKYTIFDVVMPLPGQEVRYPGGELGERYRKCLETDGLDPDNFVRKQKEYSLRGSYRKILHRPQDVSWKIMKYTDPDVGLTQADEDVLLGYERPKEDSEGMFRAVQVRFTLGTAAYATMALRELLKTETGSQHQASLTQKAEDRNFRGVRNG